jgi:hypothetical protein
MVSLDATNSAASPANTPSTPRIAGCRPLTGDQRRGIVGRSTRSLIPNRPLVPIPSSASKTHIRRMPRGTTGNRRSPRSCAEIIKRSLKCHKSAATRSVSAGVSQARGEEPVRCRQRRVELCSGQRPCRVAVQEGRDLVLVLRHQERTGHVDKLPTRRDEGGGGIEDFGLHVAATRRAFRASAATSPPDRAAMCLNRCTAHRKALCRIVFPPRAPRSLSADGHASALRPGGQIGHPARCCIMGEHLSRRPVGNRQRLAAAPRTIVEDAAGGGPVDKAHRPLCRQILKLDKAPR